MPKREARIARDLENKLNELEKSARLKERIPIGGVRTGAEPAAKQVRTGANPGSVFSMKMQWSCDAPDIKDAWTWGVARQWTQGDWDGVILPKLQEWSKLTWAEIDRFSSGTGHKMHHNMDSEDICEEAQYRMIEIERCSDVIFRFRLGNKRRLWGQRAVDKFEILWFDATHEIYPTDPD
ncbi:MAG: hypothetical protein E5Y73_25140 [Mesorhizobium sp.]|uniref:hypothetical protein n=1 Tax=Mesorhizobium sp. TaxID=1871066 RepID=UPI0011FDAD82|nr:hypothetical protein [Mesorhizobium sp.]TIL87498.1 MAG: hypothetical protein E5Y73_25140 [Mesorhizobium sp.]